MKDKRYLKREKNENKKWNEIGKNKTYERSATIEDISCNKGFL